LNPKVCAVIGANAVERLDKASKADRALIVRRASSSSWGVVCGRARPTSTFENVHSDVGRPVCGGCGRAVARVVSPHCTVGCFHVVWWSFFFVCLSCLCANSMHVHVRPRTTTVVVVVCLRVISLEVTNESNQSSFGARATTRRGGRSALSCATRTTETKTTIRTTITTDAW
jgi:hypothetical protein